MNAYDIAKDLDREGKFPGHVCYGTSPLLVRGANKLRQQAKRIAELEKKLEQIIEGCQNVKTEDNVHEDAKKLATLVIRDCNLTLKGNKMTTFTTDDRESCYPPHVVTSGASPKTPKTLAEYIEQESREEMLRHQLEIASEEIRKLQEENMRLKREVENLMDGRC